MVYKTEFKTDKDKREIVVIRTYNAPREKVFDTMTNKDLIPQWWGPREMTTKVDKMDLKPGGTWRFVQYDKAGKEFAFNGKYKEIKRPERLVYTFVYEGMPGKVLTETVRLEENNGKTTSIDRLKFPSVEDMEGMLKAGMEMGARESNDRFAELLKRI